MIFSQTFNLFPGALGVLAVNKEVHEHNPTDVQEGTEDTALIDAQLTLINTEVAILDSIMGNIYELQSEKLHA